MLQQCWRGRRSPDWFSRARRARRPRRCPCRVTRAQRRPRRFPRSNRSPFLTRLAYSSASSDPNYQELGADLDLSGGPYLSATLSVDLSTTCVPFSSWAGDPPPKGQNWPADCDAFDRNFEISLDGPEPSDAGVMADAAPGLELVRAITPLWRAHARRTQPDHGRQRPARQAPNPRTNKYLSRTRPGSSPAPPRAGMCL